MTARILTMHPHKNSLFMHLHCRVVCSSSLAYPFIPFTYSFLLLLQVNLASTPVLLLQFPLQTLSLFSILAASSHTHRPVALFISHYSRIYLPRTLDSNEISLLDLCHAKREPAILI
jgi:hypothetical protein